MRDYAVTIDKGLRPLHFGKIRICTLIVQCRLTIHMQSLSQAQLRDEVGVFLSNDDT